jgi:hypothetical protein
MYLSGLLIVSFLAFAFETGRVFDIYCGDSNNHKNIGVSQSVGLDNQRIMVRLPAGVRCFFCFAERPN